MPVNSPLTARREPHAVLPPVLRALCPVPCARTHPHSSEEGIHPMQPSFCPAVCLAILQVLYN